jgi:hypothetical protein
MKFVSTRPIALLILLALLPITVSAQARRHPEVLGNKGDKVLCVQKSGGVDVTPEKCNARQRQAKKPWTWLKSNMCQADYDVWVEPRLKDHWYRDKYFYIGLAVIGASIAADAHSTVRGVDMGLIEGNPILGQHPSHGRVAGFALLDFGAQTTFHALAWHESHQDPSKAWRTIGRLGEPVGIFAVNGRQAIKNYRLEARWQK